MNDDDLDLRRRRQKSKRDQRVAQRCGTIVDVGLEGGELDRLVDKERKYAQYKEDLEKAKVAVVAEYRGLTVEQLSGLRRDLYKQDAKFSIVKNTIIKRAIKGTDGEALWKF